MRLVRAITALAAGTALVTGTLLPSRPPRTLSPRPSRTRSSGPSPLHTTTPSRPPTTATPTTPTSSPRPCSSPAPTPRSSPSRRPTLSAPNDRAFEVLANKLGVLGPNHRHGATVEEKAGDPRPGSTRLGSDKIRQVLPYHVLVSAKVTGKQVLSGPFYQRLTMANGQKLSLTVLSRSTAFPITILGDKNGRFFNDYVIKSKINIIQTDNVVVHGISDVLLPTLS